MAAGLIVGIEYSDSYCQTAVYNQRHDRAESVPVGTDRYRYTIPAVLCFDPDKNDWKIGDSALRACEEGQLELVTEPLKNAVEGKSIDICGTVYSYKDLLTLYFRRILAFLQIKTSGMRFEIITITLSSSTSAEKSVLRDIFRTLKLEDSQVCFQNNSECFGYFMQEEPEELKQHGAALFDFREQGFTARYMYFIAARGVTFEKIDDYDLSEDFSLSGLDNDYLRQQMEQRLLNVFFELKESQGVSAVYFTGSGFESDWFANALHEISRFARVFQGNNIYVKGACTYGYKLLSNSEEYPMLCSGRTTAGIGVDVLDKGSLVTLELSKPVVPFDNACYIGDFILETEQSLMFRITGVLTGEQHILEMDLSQFPQRPPKTTRLRISISYQDNMVCEISAEDMGFGEFYLASGIRISKQIHLEGFN